MTQFLFLLTEDPKSVTGDGWTASPLCESRQQAALTRQFGEHPARSFELSAPDSRPFEAVFDAADSGGAAMGPECLIAVLTSAKKGSHAICLCYGLCDGEMEVYEKFSDFIQRVEAGFQQDPIELHLAYSVLG